MNRKHTLLVCARWVAPMFLFSVIVWGLIYVFAFDNRSSEKITVFKYAESTETQQLKKKITAETNVDTYLTVCKNEKDVFPKPIHASFFSADLVIIPEKCLINIDCANLFVPITPELLKTYRIEGDFKLSKKNGENYGIVVYSHDDGINLLKRFMVFNGDPFIVCVSKLTPNSGEYSTDGGKVKTENAFKALRALLN